MQDVVNINNEDDMPYGKYAKKTKMKSYKRKKK